jgi:hypothetical protein
VNYHVKGVTFTADVLITPPNNQTTFQFHNQNAGLGACGVKGASWSGTVTACE